MYIQFCIFVGPKCRPGSTGQAYIGVNNKILDPDENGFGEVAVSSRNVFMGYHKDPIRTEESFQGQKDTRTPRQLKYGSEEKGSSLCKCSILLGFFMSKKLERLRSELFSEDKITNLLGFLTK